MERKKAIVWIEELLRAPARYVFRVVIPILILPLLLFFVASPWLGANEYPLPSGLNIEPAAWLRWDSFHYLSIARQGYSAQPCGQFVCGNTGWFPLFPWMIKAFATLGLSISSAALFVTLLSLLVSSEILSRLIQRRWSPVAVAAAFLLLPGGIYHVAAFPISLTTALDLSAIWLFLYSYLGGSTVSAFLAVLAYPSSVILSITLSPFLLERTVLQRVQPTFLRILPIAAPLFGYFAARAWIDHASGIVSAYSLTQARYGHSWSLTFSVLRSSVRYFWKNPVYFQTATVFVLMIVATALVLRHLSYTNALLSLSFLLMGWSCWVLPHFIGDSISIYRQEALLAPFFVFAGSYLPRKVVVFVSVPLIAISVVMTRLFFVGELV